MWPLHHPGNWVWGVCGYAGGLYSHSQLGEPRGAPVDRGPQSGCHQSPQGLSRTWVRWCWGRPSFSLSGELPGLVGGGLDLAAGPPQAQNAECQARRLPGGELPLGWDSKARRDLMTERPSDCDPSYGRGWIRNPAQAPSLGSGWREFISAAESPCLGRPKCMLPRWGEVAGPMEARVGVPHHLASRSSGDLTGFASL